MIVTVSSRASSHHRVPGEGLAARRREVRGEARPLSHARAERAEERHVAHARESVAPLRRGGADRLEEGEVRPREARADAERRRLQRW